MHSFRKTVQQALTSPTAATLAKHAPFALLTLFSGGMLGAVAATPALATAGAGMLAAGVATNIVSSLLYDIFKPGTSEDERSAAIQRGLEAGDSQVQALVAGVVLDAAPILAEDAYLAPTVVPALLNGMKQAGTVLSELASRLEPALQNPATDWNAFRTEQEQRIRSVALSIEASDTAQVRDNVQRTTGVSGDVTMSIKASGNSVVERNIQEAHGGNAPQSASGDGAGTSDQRTKLLGILLARLAVREEQVAIYGIDAPPHMRTERDDLRAEVERLQKLV